MRGFGILRLTKDIEERNNVYRLSLVENIYNYSTKENEGHFWNAVAFGKTGERLFNNVRKGQRINVTVGEFKNNNYEKNGVQVYSTQLVIREFEFVEPHQRSFSSEEAKQVHEDIKPKYEPIDVTEDMLPF